AETVESGIAERQTILGFVHPEAAGSAGAGREEYVLVDDFLFRKPLFFQALQILDQIADGKIGRVALPVVAVLFAGLECLDIRRRNRFGTVAEAFQCAVNELFVLPGQTAEQQGRMGPLVPGERALDGTLELVYLPFDKARFSLQTRTLFGEPLLNHIL